MTATLIVGLISIAAIIASVPLSLWIATRLVYGRPTKRKPPPSKRQHDD